jgi:hypothetical protein
MFSRVSVAHNLASAFLAGPWSQEDLVSRGAEACGGRFRWIAPLVRRVLVNFAAPSGFSDLRILTDFLLTDQGFCLAWARHRNHEESLVRRIFWVPAAMTPVAGAPASWTLPTLTSPGALAKWLGLTPGELDWFADCQRRERQASPGPLRHYTYHYRVTRRKVRLLEVPKSRLKEIQRRLLHELLDHIPAHEAAHGYCRGRSLATYVAPHTGRQIVLHLDLCDFFPSVRSARVHALFRTAGYPEAVARLLTGLCTNAVPPDVLDALPYGGPTRGREDARLHLASPHLPQGAPTSPALANLCAYRLDCRLTGLAGSVGAAYTRYADDLVFSGDKELARGIRRFHIHVCRIALEEGFEVNTRKSHFMRQGIRQQVAGVVLNARPNITRPDFDRLKAILTNCVRLGPRSQNRDGRPDFRAHLAGRIAHVGMLHPARGQRLRQLFDQIHWEDTPPSASSS